jgi:hypothetical protein
MNVGLMFSFRNPPKWKKPWADVNESQLEQTKLAKDLGYDTVWLTEHHFAEDGYSPSLMTLAGAVAAKTRRVRIGTFLLLLPLHNAVRVAEDAATVDVISRGLRSRYRQGVREARISRLWDSQQGACVTLRRRHRRDARHSGPRSRSPSRGSTTICRTSDLRRSPCSSRTRRSGWALSIQRRWIARHDSAATTSASAIRPRTTMLYDGTAAILPTSVSRNSSGCILPLRKSKPGTRSRSTRTGCSRSLASG